MERGLTALDSLYELRNVIPELMDGSGMNGQEGKSCNKIEYEVNPRRV